MTDIILVLHHFRERVVRHHHHHHHHSPPHHLVPLPLPPLLDCLCPLLLHEGHVQGCWVKLDLLLGDDVVWLVGVAGVTRHV